MKVLNAVDGREYLISVVPVHKSVNINLSAKGLTLSPLVLRNIRFQAAIYVYNPHVLRRFMAKPILVLNLENRSEIDRSSFTKFVQSLVEVLPMKDLLDEDESSKILQKFGLTSVFQRIWSVWFLSSVKHIFIWRTVSD